MTRALLVALTLLLAGPATAPAAGPCTDDVTIGDTDGDTVADLVAGVPDARRLVARQTADPDPFSVAGDVAFGYALALADTNGDGCSDVLAGTPTIGRVDVFSGSSPDGLTAAVASTLTSPGDPGDGFGAAIAVSDRGSSGASRDLWIGAPNASVAGKAGAGAVYHYVLPAGMPPQAAGRVTVDDAEVPGEARAGARFGRILSPTANGVLVGVPNAGPARRGAVYAVRLDENGAAAAGQRLHGTAGDRFGAAVAVDPRGHRVIVGAPGARHGAGAVVVYPDDRLKRGSGTRLTQGTHGVPGVAARGDRFGASVVFGLALGGCQEAAQWAAGAPGDDVAGARNAGTVTVVAPDPLEAQACPGQTVRAGRGLAGRPHAGARLGTGLSLIRLRDDFDEDTYDGFAVTVPGQRLVLQRKTELDVGGTGPIALAIPESGRAF